MISGAAFDRTAHDHHSPTGGCHCVCCNLAVKLHAVIRQEFADGHGRVLNHELLRAALARVVGDFIVLEGQDLIASTELAEHFADQMMGWINARIAQGAAPKPLPKQ